MKVRATICSPSRRYSEELEITPDLPPDPIGEVTVMVLRAAREQEEDLTTNIVVLEFVND